MANIEDPEKDICQPLSSPDPDSTGSDSILNEDVEKYRQTTASTATPISHSNLSHDSINTDPLSPLERALTPDLETDAEHLARPQITYTKTGTSLATTGSRLPSFEVDFAGDDPEDPRNWPLWYKGLTVGAVSYTTWTVILYSTSYTSSTPGMMKEFHETSEPVATLGVTTYLTGLAVGSLMLAPLSEIYGRRVVYIGSIIFFCLMVLPCALATSLPEVLVVRFFG